jgi:hypothetical protein
MTSHHLNIPRIIHLMFFPWGKDQKLLADQTLFDHRPYERMVRYAPDFEVKLWDYPATEKLCLEYYPDIWRVANEQPRPMMLVNTLRWLMVYHFGGISWQYDMNPLVPMHHMLPSPGKSCRVYTEFELTPEECQIQAIEPIRNGEPEESVRIPSQVFAATPKHRYMKAVVDFIHDRSKTMTFKRDYDCQFMTGNAAASTAYDRFGKNDPSVERVGPVETRQMMKILYQGTWRTESDKKNAPQKHEQNGSSPAIAALRSSLVALAKTVPGYYRVKPHLHEVAFAETRRQSPGLVFVDDRVKREIGDACTHMGFSSVLNYPSVQLAGLSTMLPPHVSVTDVDMVRTSGSSPFFNIMFSRLPRVDVAVMRNFLDHISTKEAQEVLTRLRNAGIGYVLCTHYPCLNVNWDNFAGEWRPLNLTLKPYGLPEPEVWIADPDPDRRTDRGLGLFKL